MKMQVKGQGEISGLSPSTALPDHNSKSVCHVLNEAVGAFSFFQRVKFSAYSAKS